MKQKIAIYGLGQETQKNIGELSEQFDIVGLLDSYQDNGEMYGFPVISVIDAIEQGIEKIIVIARPGSCKAIANTIGKICEQNKVDVVDVNGNNLIVKNVVKYNFDDIVGTKKAELLKMIDEVDTVSFDLFDTLIVRQTLCYESFITLLGYKILQEGFVVDDFSEKRLKAEIELSRNSVPSLKEIYGYIVPDCSQSEISEYIECEYQFDKSLLVPREEVVAIINKCIELGKKTYITTDTYYSEQQIREIIEQCGIDKSVKILVSCEEGTTKSRGMFDILKDRSAGENILHVGDDLQIDIKSAEAHGIKTFHVLSARDCFDMLGGLGINEDIQNVYDETKVGILLADIFNSPFVFEEKDLPMLSNAQEVGFVIYAPMILDFVCWIKQEVAKQNISNVLFSARDGYILQKIYSLLYPNEKTYYFLTSRIAVSRACIESREDIEYIESTRFTGSLLDELFVRYGIDERQTFNNVDESANGIMRYKDIILKNAKQKKQNYLKYFESLEIPKGEIAFIDLSARGTIQMFFERLIGKKVTGFYFLQLEPLFAQNKGLDIEPFFIDDGKSENIIMNDFHIMEPVISSPYTSIEEFDEMGKPIYSEEVRSEEEIRVMEQIQKGILKYAKIISDICPDEVISVNKKLDEDIFSLVHKIRISSKDFYLLRNIDSFVNRITNINVGV